MDSKPELLIFARRNNVESYCLIFYAGTNHEVFVPEEEAVFTKRGHFQIQKILEVGELLEVQVVQAAKSMF